MCRDITPVSYLTPVTSEEGDVSVPELQIRKLELNGVW